MDEFLKWLDKTRPGERAYLTPYQLELAKAHFEKGVVLSIPRSGGKNVIRDLIIDYYKAKGVRSA
jgi:hypothetical protein